MDGVDIRTVKDILGHQKIQTTMRYAHLASSHLQDAINKVNLVGTGSKSGSEALEEISAWEYGSSKPLKDLRNEMAGGPGIEPGQSDPESDVLPLDDPPSLKAA